MISLINIIQTLIKKEENYKKLESLRKKNIQLLLLNMISICIIIKKIWKKKIKKKNN